MQAQKLHQEEMLWKLKQLALKLAKALESATAPVVAARKFPVLSEDCSADSEQQLEQCFETAGAVKAGIDPKSSSEASGRFD